MPQITTYRSVKSVAMDHNFVTEKMAELIRDLKDLTPPLALLDVQMVAGHVYVHASDTLSPDLLSYYDVEKVS